LKLVWLTLSAWLLDKTSKHQLVFGSCAGGAKVGGCADFRASVLCLCFDFFVHLIEDDPIARHRMKGFESLQMPSAMAPPGRQIRS
jgi:hypothetical protein